MSLERHCNKGRQHNKDLGADVDPPKLTHPYQDTNLLHEISSHRGLQQRGNIRLGGTITSERVVLLPWQGESPFGIILGYLSTFLTAC